MFFQFKLSSFRRAVSRYSALLFGSFLLTNQSLAQNTPSPDVMNGWSSTGELPLIDHNQVLTLPAGSELFRTFQADHLAVSIFSRPYFSPAPEGASSLEVGPISLMFVRNVKDGAVVLFNDKPLSLPFHIDIGRDGRSLKPFSITLTYNRIGKSARVDLGGDNVSVTVSPNDGPIDVALASGANADWTIDEFFVDHGFVRRENRPAVRDQSVSSIRNTANPGGVLVAGETIDLLLRLIKSGKIEKVKEILSKESIHPPQSLPSKRELAKKLVFLALILRQNSSYSDANAVAVEVLNLLNETGAESSTKEAKAIAYKTSGFVKREILRDTVGARLEYETAYREHPQPSTRLLLDRMAKEDAKQSVNIK